MQRPAKCQEAVSLMEVLAVKTFAEAASMRGGTLPSI